MTTLRDILKICPFVTLLELDVRDTDLKLKKHVVIGKDYHVSVHQRDDERKGMFEYMPIDINKHGRPTGSSGFSEMAYAIDWKAIPKEYLDMEVETLCAVTDRYGVSKGDRLRAHIVPVQMRMEDL